MEEKRDEYLRQNAINYVEYLSSIGNSYNEKINQLSYLIGTEHFLSVGQYKENLLIESLRQFVPNKYEIGTGFVAFPNYSVKNIGENQIMEKKFTPSRQLDIVIYDAHNYSPLFRDGNFVVLTPDSVRVIIEVKGYLSKSNDFMDNIIDFGGKWSDYISTFKNVYGMSQHINSLKAPSIFAFNWQEYVDVKGNALSQEALLKHIVKKYRTYFSDKADQCAGAASSNYRLFPVLNSCYLYNKFIITDICSHDPNSWGYAVGKGKYEIPISEENWKEKGDKTISHLIIQVQNALKVMNNPFQQSADCFWSENFRTSFYEPIYLFAEQKVYEK